MDTNSGSSRKLAKLHDHQSEHAQLSSDNQNQASSVQEEAEETGLEYEAISSNSDISHVIDCLTPAELRHLYISLGLDTPSIEKAEDSTGTFDVKIRARKVLELWRQQLGQNATRKCILEALESCRYRAAKELLQDKWKVTGTYTHPSVQVPQTKQLEVPQHQTAGTQHSLSTAPSTNQDPIQSVPQHQIGAQSLPSTSDSSNQCQRIWSLSPHQTADQSFPSTSHTTNQDQGVQLLLQHQIGTQKSPSTAYFINQDPRIQSVHPIGAQLSSLSISNLTNAMPMYYPGPHALQPTSFMQPHASSSAQGTHLLPQQQITRPSFPGATYLMDTHYPSVPQIPAHQQYQPFDVASCQDQLKAIYRRQRGGIGFLPGFPKEYSLDEYFVDLQILKQQKTTTEVEHTELKTYIDLLEIKDKKGQRLNHMLVSGLAGTGKTTLISRIASQWATQDETESNTETKPTQQSKFPLDRYKLVFALDIRAFKPDLDLVNTVIDQLLENYSTCKNNLEAFLSANADKCLYLLDGYDELQNTSEKVLKSSLLHRSCVIVTSRPNTVDRFNRTNQGYVQVQLNGFSESSVGQFVYRYFNPGNDRGMHVSEEAEKIMTKIESTEFLHTISSFPLLLAMMCLIWQDTQDLPDTVSSLYKQVIEYLTRHWKARDDSFISIPLKDFKEKVNNLLLLVGKTALGGLMREDSKLIFREDEFGSSLVEQACNLGVMSCESKRIRFDKVTYVSFIHKTFQEYCAAVYLASLAESDQDLLRSYLTRMNEKDMEYVLKFSCGVSRDAAKIILQHLVVKSQQCQIKDITEVEFSELRSNEYHFWRLPLILLYEAESQAEVRHQSLHTTLEPLTAPFTLTYDVYRDSEYKAVLSSLVNTNQSRAGWLSYVDKAVIDFREVHSDDAAMMINLLCQMSSLSDLALRDDVVVDDYDDDDDDDDAVKCSKVNECLQSVIKHNVFSKGLKKLVLSHSTSFICSSLNEFLIHQKHLELLQFKNWRSKFDFALFYPDCLQKFYLHYDTYYSKLSKINVESLESLNHTNLIIFEVKHALIYKQSNTLSMLKLPKLKQLSLVGCLNEQSAKALAVSLKYSPELHTLALKSHGYCMEPHGAVAAIASLCHMPHLTVLDLEGNAIGDKEVIELSKSLSYVPCLENVNVGYNQIGPKGIIALSNSFQHIKQVKVMKINNNQFKDEGIKAVANSLAYIPQLKRLDLGWNGISHAGCGALGSSLQYIPELSHLDLSWNNIGDDGITALSQSLHCIPNVTHLDLRGIYIGNNGVIELCRSIHQHHIPQLQYLDLSENEIGDDGFIAFAKSLHHIPQLTHLDLKNKAIGDDGIIALAASFHEVPHLTILELDTHSSYGPAGLEAVFKNLVYLPELKELYVTCKACTPIAEYSHLLNACVKELGWDAEANTSARYLTQEKIKQVVNVVSKFNS